VQPDVLPNAEMLSNGFDLAQSLKNLV